MGRRRGLLVGLALCAAGAALVQAQDAAPVHIPYEHSPYWFWYGNPHAHSTRSDGGGDASAGDCSADTMRVDQAYPDDAFVVAATVGEMDWMMVAEHNHLFDDAKPFDTLTPTYSAAQLFAQGRAMADAATTEDFVAIYGQEWGTITGCGHVLVYDAPLLFGWEAGQYDVYTPWCQYTGYNGLYDKAARAGNVSPATGRAHLVLCHPSDPDMFASYARDAWADTAVEGCAIISGSATSCAENFGSGGTSSTDAYKDRYIALLDAGWRIAPEGHQDNHADNYGNHSQVRTVALAETLSRECLLNAQHERRVYATQDRNGQLQFTATAGNCVAHAMGEQMGGAGGVALHASWWDPDMDPITAYRILRGQVGAGISAFAGLTVLATGFTGTPAGAVTINVNDNPGSGVYYYLVDLRQSGKGDPWTRHTLSAPLWVDFGQVDAGAVPAACATLTAPAEVSPMAAAVPLTVTRAGSAVQLKFSYEKNALYHLYVANSAPAVTGGAYDVKWCDLARNTQGTFASDGSTWCTFTVANIANLPAGWLVVVAERGGLEGSYGVNGQNQPRAHDSDRTAPVTAGCPATCTP